MSRAIRLALVALAAVVVVNDSAEAQRRRGLVDVSPSSDRRGFWLEGAIGWGEESYRCTPQICGAGVPVGYTDALGKPTLSIRLGGTVNPHLRLGGEVTTWWNSYSDFDDIGEFDVTETLTEVMAIARVYPVRDLGLYVKGGAGLGVTTASVEFGDTDSETGFATTLGAGYEIKVSRQLFITPAVDYYMNRFEQRNADTLKERLWNFSIGVTWQPGR